MVHIPSHVLTMTHIDCTGGYHLVRFPHCIVFAAQETYRLSAEWQQILRGQEFHWWKYAGNGSAQERCRKVTSVDPKIIFCLFGSCGGLSVAVQREFGSTGWVAQIEGIPDINKWFASRLYPQQCRWIIPLIHQRLICSPKNSSFLLGRQKPQGASEVPSALMGFAIPMSSELYIYNEINQQQEMFGDSPSISERMIKVDTQNGNPQEESHPPSSQPSGGSFQSCELPIHPQSCHCALQKWLKRRKSFVRSCF